MTNSEAMVTSAAPSTTESKHNYPQGMSEARHGAVLFFERDFFFSQNRCHIPNTKTRDGSSAQQSVTHTLI